MLFPGANARGEGCCWGFLQRLRNKRGFSPLKHPEKEASERIPGGQPGQWGTPPWGKQGARSCYQEVLQALGTASSSAQPFITSS